MRFNLRPAIWLSALAFVIAMCGMQQSAALPLPQGDQHSGGHDDDRNSDYTNNRHYQDGFRQGQQDRASHRDRQYQQNFGNDNDRRAYEAGYNQGYQQNDGGRDRNDNNSDRDNHGRDRDSFHNPGYRMGFQDGTNDGQSDRAARRRFKYGKGYKHPDRGYVASYGDKRAYEQQYREAYEKAYQDSYNGHDHGR